MNLTCKNLLAAENKSDLDEMDHLSEKRSCSIVQAGDFHSESDLMKHEADKHKL